MFKVWLFQSTSWRLERHRSEYDRFKPVKITFADDNAMTEPRWALYFAPPAALGQLGQQWLSDTFEPAAPWTTAPRRYGFHATLKAPFRLAPGYALCDLTAAVADWSQRQSPFFVRLSVQWLGDFLALRPVARTDIEALSGLAASAVEQLDPFRAELSAAEQQRRLAAPLTVRERDLLARWGYPYVFEAFRFHCTLTEPLPTAIRPRLFALAEQHFNGVLSQPTPIDRVVLAEEPAPGANFVIVASFRLGAFTPGVEEPPCAKEFVA